MTYYLGLCGQDEPQYASVNGGPVFIYNPHPAINDILTARREIEARRLQPGRSFEKEHSTEECLSVLYGYPAR